MRKNVLEYLEEAAVDLPDKILFGDEKRELTYQEFRDLSRRIGSGLIRAMGNRRNRPVAVLTDRSAGALPGFFGTVYSGNFYIPIDRRMPPDRVRRMLGQVRAELLLALRADEGLIRQWREALSRGASGLPPETGACERGGPSLGTSAKEPSGKEETGIPPVLYLEELAKCREEPELLRQVCQEQLDTDPLYAIFTSGSTGVPKAVLVSHRSVLDLADQFREEFGFDASCVFGNQAPFDFDVSVKDIYSTLRNRGTMWVISQTRFSFPGKLIQYLNEKRINTIIWAVSALRILENLKGFSGELPRFLRTVCFSGETMPVKVLNYWKSYLPDTRFVNLYGPTEITCNCTFYKVEREFREGELLPIGRPFQNSGVFLLDGKELVTEPDCPGEICVRGTCLALGYYNDPERTREAFCQNPLNPHYPERIYRTGDIGKYNREGELVFLSRKDSQIKHMGHRIELGEVEAAVNGLKEVEAGICHYQQGQIILCYQAPRPCQREILVELSQKLPKYMCPTRFWWHPKLPTNKNGKIHRALLRDQCGEWLAGT